MKKTSLLTAVFAALAIVGVIIMGVAFAIGGKFDNSESKNVKYELKDSFTKISADVASADIVIKSTDEAYGYAECIETEDRGFCIEVEGGTLSVKERDGRHWYDFISFGHSGIKAVIYIPAGEYEELTADLASGYIKCEDEKISFTSADISVESGDISLSSNVADALSVSASSGETEISDISPKTLSASSSSEDIELKNVKALESITLKASSGEITLDDSSAPNIKATAVSGGIRLSGISADGILELSANSGSIKLSDSTAKNVKANAVSGNISLSNVLADGVLDIKASSGSITLSLCDAGELMLECSSGNIRATLLSDKIFNTSTGSGRIDCPDSVKNAGFCTVKTGSGNIKIEIAEEQ